MPAAFRLSAYAARNLRAERHRVGLKQDELGEAAGLSRNTVSLLETGQRAITLDDLPPLCRALGVSLSKLLEGASPEDLSALGLS